MGWFKKFRKFLKEAAPIITVVVAIVAPNLAPAIGKALGANATYANAIGSAVIAGSTTAAAGGDIEDIAKSAVIGGTSAYVGDVAGSAAGGAAKSAGYSDEVANVLAASASGGAQSTTQALGYGADVEQALKEGVIGSLAAGATTGTMEAFKEGQQPGVKIPASGSPSDVPEVGLRAGTPRAAADMDGGTGIVPPSDVMLPRSTRADIAAGRAMVDADGNVIPMMRTPEGRIIPAMTDADGRLISKPVSYDLADTSTKYGVSTAETIDRPYRPSALGEFGEEILAQYIYPEFYKSASGLFDTNTPAPSQSTQVGVESTGTPSSAALAQALRVGDAGEPVFGTDDLGKQKRVWNVSSLKLKDEVGG